MIDEPGPQKIKKLPLVAIWISQLIVLYLGAFYLYAWYSKSISGQALLLIFLGLLVIEEGLRRLKKKYPNEYFKMKVGSVSTSPMQKKGRLLVLIPMTILFFIFILSVLIYIILLFSKSLSLVNYIIGFFILAVLGAACFYLKKKFNNEYRIMSEPPVAKISITDPLSGAIPPANPSAAVPIYPGVISQRNRSMAIVLIIFVFLQALLVLPFSKGADLTQYAISAVIDIYIIYSLFRQQNVLNLIIVRAALGFVIWGGQSFLHANWLDFILQSIYSSYFITMAATKPSELKTKILSITVIPLYLLIFAGAVIYNLVLRYQ